MAGLARFGTFARKTGLPLQQHRLGLRETQVELEGACRDAAAVDTVVDLARAVQLPVAQREVGVALGRVSQAPAGAGDALVVQQLAVLQVGDGRVRKDQLARSKAAGAVRGHVYP